LYLEVRPDYIFIFLGTQARLFIFKFLAARIPYLFPKTASPPAKREHYLRGHTKLISRAQGGSMD
jgi:hypothetical protein